MRVASHLLKALAILSDVVEILSEDLELIKNSWNRTEIQMKGNISYNKPIIDKFF